MAKEVATMERVFTEPTSSDYLVCGTCTRNFPLENFVGFVQHKRFDCDDEVQTSTGMRQTTTLLCQSCPGRFGTPWSLLKHAQNVHALQIYLEQGAYSEGVSSVRVHEEGWEQPRSQESAVSETCASPQDESSNSVATQLSTFKEVARQVEHSVMETQSEGDSMDGSDEKHEAHTGDVTATRTQTSDASSARKKEVCCDSQECGISLMPITHEEPKKCCCAVVPKWRKRHMETKHMHGASSGANTSTTDKPQSPSIFIDLVPSTGIGKNMPDVSTLVESHSEDNSSYSMTVVSNNSAQTTSTERSVIIQPGTSFSIPIRYTSPPTSAASGLSSETITTSVLSNTSQFADYHSLLSHKELSTDASPAVLAAEGPSSGSRENEVESDSGNGVSGNLQASGKKRRYPTSRPFKCDQCDNAFNQRIHLKKHQSKHTGVKPFKCGQCDYSTVERSHLKVHIRVHTGEKPFHCTYCEYATAQNSTLKIHLKRHHANTAPFTCPTCSARFSQKTLLNCHIRREHATDTVASSSSMVVSGPRGINMGQGHLQQSEGYTIQGLGEGYFRSHMESFTDQGRFERDNEDTPERLKMAKELKPHFSGESPHSS